MLLMKYVGCAVLTRVIGILWSHCEILMWLSSRGFAAFCASQVCQLGFTGWEDASFKQMASLQWWNWCLEALTVCKINSQNEPDLVIAWLQPGGVQTMFGWNSLLMRCHIEFILSYSNCFLEPGLWLTKRYKTFKRNSDTHNLKNSC